MSAFGTLELMSLPRGKSTVDYKWVFIVKNNSFSIIERCKVRLVVKGLTHTHGVDY